MTETRPSTVSNWFAAGVVAGLAALSVLGSGGCSKTPPTKTRKGSRPPTATAAGPEQVRLHPVKIDGLYGYVDSSGRLVIRPQFERAWYFTEGLAVVRTGTGWHVIDPTGRLVTRQGYAQLYGFHGGLCRAAGPCGVGFLDRKGREVIPRQLPFAFDFSLGLAPFQDGSGKWGMVDRDVHVAIPARFECLWSMREGLAAAKLEGKFGFIDAKGTFAIVPTFEDVDAESGGFREDLALVKADGKWGYIGKDGSWVIPPRFTGFTRAFHEGLAIVERGEGQWGFIDKTGRFAIAPEFGWLGHFSEGLAGAAKAFGAKGNVGYIDKSGRYVIRPQFDQVEVFRCGLGRVWLAGKCALLDHAGRPVWKEDGFPDVAPPHHPSSRQTGQGT